MSVTQLTHVNGYLKRDYQGPMRDLINLLSVYWSKVKKTRKYVEGDALTAFVPTAYGDNQGIGSVAESADLPAAGRNLRQYMQIASAYHYGRFHLTGQAIAASKGREHAFASAQSDNVKTMVRQMGREMNRQAHGRGTGAMARLPVGTATTVALGATISVDDASRLSRGMLISTFTTNAGSGGTAGWAGVTIDYVDYRNNKIVLVEDPSGLGDQAGDYIYRTGSRGNVMMGLEGHVDGPGGLGTQILTTYQAITRASFPEYTGNVFDNSGVERAMEVDIIQQAFEAGEAIGSGGTCNLILSDYTQRRKYLEMLGPDRRWVKYTLDGGWTGLEFTGGGEPVMWHADNMCLGNRVYFIDTGAFAVHEAMPFKWLLTGQSEGSILEKVANKDEWEASYGGYCNLGGFEVNRCSVLKDLRD
jgi:hypothetical protein